MKTFAILPLFAALCLATPATGWARDRHHHHHSRPVISFGYQPYSYGCYPSYYRSYSPSYYSGYPSSSSYSYYSRPSIGLSYSSGPSYTRSVRSSVRGYDEDLAVDVQRALARRGYYRGAIDGDIGSGTRAAIRRYQYHRRLEVTGRIDRSLLASLGLG